MIVACPNCQTKFDIPDDKYRPGRKARCSNCGFVFVLPETDAADAPPAPVEAAAPPAPEPEPAFSEQPDEPSATAQPEAAPEPEDSETDAEQDIPPPASVEDAVLDDSAQKTPDKKKIWKDKKKLAVIAAGALLSVLLVFGGYTVYSALFMSKPETTSAEEGARMAAVRRLAITSPQQYVERGNKNTGPIVVISGSVTNNFDTPKSLILLEVTLYDAKGRVIAVREQYCGVTLPQIQLQSMTKEALEAALNNPTVIMINNTNVAPGNSVPFMALFFGAATTAYEFEVKIVDVKDKAPANG